METLIRRLTDPTGAEREALAGLLVTTVEDGASIGFLPPLSMADARAYWTEIPDAPTILLVAERAGEIVGSIQGHLAGRANARHRAEITKLMVHPAARRQGIARSLMQAVEEVIRADGRTLIVLDTRDGDPSNALYRRLGYIEAGRIPGYARSASGTLDATVLYYRELPAD